MKTYFITGLKNSSNQLLKPHAFDGLEEGMENNKHEPISQNGTKSLPSLGNNIFVKGININRKEKRSGFHIFTLHVLVL